MHTLTSLYFQKRAIGTSLPINTPYRPKDGSSTVGCENTITPNEPSEATAKLGGHCYS